MTVTPLVIARSALYDEAIPHRDDLKATAVIMERHFFVYIMTNRMNTVLYTGVTNNLKRRVFEHKEMKTRSFTSRYNATKLVYYETLGDSHNAISREKQIKAGSRQKKVDLVDAMNPTWRDLYDEL